MNEIILIASKEFIERLKNGWILAIAVSFMLFSVIISFAGLGFTGSIGQPDQEITLLSLTSLVIYLVPLLGLILGYDSISGEHEQGTLDLLHSCPISSGQILFGKWTGLSAVLMFALTIGMIIPAVIAVYQGQDVIPWLWFLVLSMWFGIVFVTLSLMMSTTLWSRGRLLGLVIGLWLIFIILFDVILIGLLVATEGNISNILIDTLFFLNPASVFRFLVIQGLFGDATLVQMGFGNHIPTITALITALILWTILPLWFARLKFSTGK
ncbi:MAG: ABC transporter permease [Gammaproteobacteria bacterium]|nr:ABC transporter permease [Gammaproteobacteria bacterium]MDH5594313.1 ABC transporter permease [Gammaproteobacteria bacterium]